MSTHIGWAVFWVCLAGYSASERSWVAFAIAAGFAAHCIGEIVARRRGKDAP